MFENSKQENLPRWFNGTINLFFLSTVIMLCEKHRNAGDWHYHGPFGTWKRVTIFLRPTILHNCHSVVNYNFARWMIIAVTMSCLTWDSLNRFLGRTWIPILKQFVYHWEKKYKERQIRRVKPVIDSSTFQKDKNGQALIPEDGLH